MTAKTMKLATAAIVLIIILPTTARAEWPPRGFFSAEPQPRTTRYYRRHRHHRRTRRVIIRRYHDTGVCKRSMTVVGDMAQSTKGAREAALKAFQQESRFRHGERFADPRNAAGVQFECVHASIKNIANRATAAVGVDTQLERCSVTATPCRATPTPVSGIK